MNLRCSLSHPAGEISPPTPRRGAMLLCVLCSCASVSYAGGGWIDAPGQGAVRVGWNSKAQPDAQRRDVDGDLYRSAFNLTHKYRFLYLQGDVGLGYNFEVSFLATYLWGDETVDSTSEDPSRHYHDFSDMWLAVKYQLLSGDYPVAIGATARFPDLYQSRSTINGQLTTNIPGLLYHDYEFDVYASHSFTNATYGSVLLGYKIREGAFAYQLMYGAEVGTRLPVLDRRISVKLALDGAASFGAEGMYTSHERFPGRYLDVVGHTFDYDFAGYIHTVAATNIDITKALHAGAGVAYLPWGHSIDVYAEWFAYTGWRF